MSLKQFQGEVKNENERDGWDHAVEEQNLMKTQQQQQQQQQQQHGKRPLNGRALRRKEEDKKKHGYFYTFPLFLCCPTGCVCVSIPVPVGAIAILCGVLGVCVSLLWEAIQYGHSGIQYWY